MAEMEELQMEPQEDPKGIVYTKNGREYSIDKGFSIYDILHVRHHERLPWKIKEGDDIASRFGLTYSILTSLRESPEWAAECEAYEQANEDLGIDLGVKDPNTSRSRRNASFKLTNQKVIAESLSEFKGRTGEITSIEVIEDGNDEVQDAIIENNLNENATHLIIKVELSEPFEVKVDDMNSNQLRDHIKELEAELNRLKESEESEYIDSEDDSDYIDAEDDSE